MPEDSIARRLTKSVGYRTKSVANMRFAEYAFFVCAGRLPGFNLLALANLPTSLPRLGDGDTEAL